MGNLRLGFIAIILIGLLSYFSYHTIYGNNGIVSKREKEKNVINLINDLEQIRSTRIELEHNVKLMRPDSLDIDMLDQQAREILGVVKKEEEVHIRKE